jgi:hypothetical protein
MRSKMVMLFVVAMAAMVLSGTGSASTSCSLTNRNVSAAGQGAIASFTASEACNNVQVTLIGVTYATNPTGSVYSNASATVGPGNHTLGPVALPCGVGTEADLVIGGPQTVGSPMFFPPPPLDQGAHFFRFDCPLPTTPTPPTTSMPTPTPPTIAPPVTPPATPMVPPSAPQPAQAFYCATTAGTVNGVQFNVGQFLQLDEGQNTEAPWSVLNPVPAVNGACPAATPAPAPPVVTPAPPKAVIVNHTTTRVVRVSVKVPVYIRQCFRNGKWISFNAALCTPPKAAPCKTRTVKVFVPKMVRAKPLPPKRIKVPVRVKVPVYVKVPGPIRWRTPRPTPPLYVCPGTNNKAIAKSPEACRNLVTQGGKG